MKELTAEQADLALAAMYEKTMETMRYLKGIDAPEVPEERHTCCTAHRLRYERDRGMLLSLTQRLAAQKELIALLESR
jgi:hypothetical protein